ncbi:hypothetical protein BCR39DRAFT_524437 [Naematelia encephala]|uniref:Uncharacterized protein n=1 Tax=Naematelia encephala TaxID=71784 RepID=A0A1Y2BCF7_9TREE|nr:hypothetical protein BCR39DRAFT_524437 [Naematelia encephala]
MPAAPKRPPQAGPSQPSRQAEALTEFQSRRLLRRLDELERTNPTDIPASSFNPPPPPLPPSSHPTSTQLGFSQQQQPKKKQSANVRRILYGKKSLKDWLDELPSEPKPPYILAATSPPKAPPRQLCSSCGYFGAYKCPRCAEWSCDMACMQVHARDGGCGIGL